MSRPCGGVWKLCPMITFEGWTSGGPLGGWLVFAGRENAREDRGEALVSRVWIFTPCRDKRAFRATLRHRHKHTCHHQYCSYLDDGDGKRGHVMWRDPCVAGNSNDEDLEKVKVEGMINLINYPFYFGSYGARNPMPYLSIDIASYDDKRHCRLKHFIVSVITIIIGLSINNNIMNWLLSSSYEKIDIFRKRLKIGVFAYTVMCRIKIQHITVLYVEKFETIP